MDDLETRARGEVPAVVGQRPATGGQGNDSECKHSSSMPCPPARALEERRPRHTFASFSDTAVPVSSHWKEARRNRRAPGASSGGKRGCDERLRSELAGYPPGAAIVRSPICSAANRGTSASRELSAFICVICVICVHIAMDALPLCLRDCDVLCVSLCVSVPLWFSWRSWRLGGSSGWVRVR